MNQLGTLIKEISFFKERNIVETFELREISKALLVEKFKPGEQVCEYGEIGNKFYIILRGSVRVDIPEVR